VHLVGFVISWNWVFI